MSVRLKKRPREKGKLPLGRLFERLEPGDRVLLKTNPSFPRAFPIRFEGRTATVQGKSGRAYIVRLRNGKKVKSFIVAKVHLVKLKR